MAELLWVLVVASPGLAMAWQTDGQEYRLQVAVKVLPSPSILSARTS